MYFFYSNLRVSLQVNGNWLAYPQLSHSKPGNANADNLGHHFAPNQSLAIVVLVCYVIITLT